jgi:hypothetical protein
MDIKIELCRDGFSCVHYEIEEICKKINDLSMVRDEAIEKLEEMLVRIRELVPRLENLVVPALLKGKPLPCRQPYSISWGRYCYDRGLEKLEEAKQEKLRRETAKAKKKYVGLKTHAFFVFL